MLKLYMIERRIPGIGNMPQCDLGKAAHVSNRAIAQVPGLQWRHSYVAADRTFCVYLAESEAAIRDHAARSGFPADSIREICDIIDPTTERLQTA